MNKGQLAVIVAIATTAVIAAVRYQGPAADPWQKLSAAVARGEAPPFVGRLSLIEIAPRQATANLNARTVTRGPSRGPVFSESAAQPNHTVQALATDVLASNATEQQKATAALLGGNSAGALKRLRILVRDPRASAGVWSDYAAVLTCTSDSEPTRLFDALAAVDHALDLDPANVPARFNRAVVLQHLNLHQAASRNT